MKEIITEIRIQAEAETVWSILTDFDKYHEWNPFIRHARGKAVEGERLEARPEISEGKGMLFRPLVTKAIPGRELRWYGHFLIPGLSDGEHIFEIHASGNNAVHFIHRQVFKGLLLPLLWPLMGEKTRAGFVKMNEALKDMSEKEDNVAAESVSHE